MILLTRPFEDSKALSKILKSKGINSFIEPMLQVTYREPDLEEFLENEPQAYIATSKNGRMFVPEDAPMAAIPEHGATGEELLEWITTNLNPKHGKLVYLRGEIISVDVKNELESKGFEVEEIIVYRTEAPSEFTERLLRNIGKISLITFFSKQTLDNFLALARQHQLKLDNIPALVLSEEIANKAEKGGFKTIHIVDEPNLNSMLKKLDELKTA